MIFRIVMGLVVVGGFGGAVACGGATSSPVTSLPSSEVVATQSTQFCADLATYLDGLAPQLAGLDCANTLQAGLQGGTTSSSACATEYAACVATVNAGTSAAFGVSTASILEGCTTEVQKCGAVTVGEISTCLSEFGDALLALSSTVTADTVCSGEASALQPPSIPASCAAIPGDCLPIAGTTTVTITGTGEVDGGVP